MTTRKIQRDRSELRTTGAKTMTIPQLRKAFEYMEKFAGGSAKSTEDIQKEWKTIFGGKGLTKEQAKSYLNEYTNLKQSGGTAPGLYTATGSIPGQVTDGGYDTYGSYPKYLMSGFDVGVPRISQGDLCGKAEVSSTPLPDTGSNLVTKGGAHINNKKKTRKAMKGIKQMNQKKQRKQRKTLRGGNRLPEATNPTTALQDAATAFRGQPMGSSPSAVDAVAPRLFPAPYTNYAGQVTPIYRTMGLDISQQ